MKKLLKKPEHFWLILILAIAAVMRFYNFAGWSLTNDELSALNRIRFDSLWEAIRQGCMINDTHPAGVHAFIYVFTKIFGLSVFAIRLPFVIAGVISVYLLFLIVRKWFNSTAAYFSAAAMAVLAFPILYAQLARPYSAGLLWSLSTVWFWTLVVTTKNYKSVKQKFLIHLAFAFSVAFAAYSHYFSALFAFMVCVSGVLFLNKQNWKGYILAGFGAALLFAPHLKITLYQFTNGFGNVSWLGPPNDDWFNKHILYCFNNSAFLPAMFGAILLVMLISGWLHNRYNKWNFIAFFWFFIPFVVGYFFSIYRTPVLQNSVLLFSFPFLLVFIFSFMGENFTLWKKVLLIAVILSGIYSTVVEKNFYYKKDFGVFKELAEKAVKWNKTFDSKNICNTVNFHSPYYINFYIEKSGNQLNYDMVRIKDQTDLGKLIELVDTCSKPFFLHAWSNVEFFPEIDEIIRSRYTYIQKKESFFGSSVTLYNRIKKHKRKVYYGSYCNFERAAERWDNFKNIDSTVAAKGNHSQLLDEKNPYSASFAINYGDICREDSCLAVITLDAKITDGATAEVVLEAPGKFWYSSYIHQYLAKPDKWGKVYLVRYIGQTLSFADIVKVYVWNTGKNKVWVDNIKVSFFKPDGFTRR